MFREPLITQPVHFGTVGIFDVLMPMANYGGCGEEEKSDGDDDEGDTKYIYTCATLSRGRLPSWRLDPAVRMRNFKGACSDKQNNGGFGDEDGGVVMGRLVVGVVMPLW